jgi:hypothetical protein
VVAGEPQLSLESAGVILYAAVNARCRVNRLQPAAAASCTPELAPSRPRYSPMRVASRSRCRFASPRNSSLALARLK